MDKPKAIDKLSVMNIEFNPGANKNAISLIRQDDGNWKGWMQKNGVLLEVRQISPQTVLEYLFFHDGVIT